jgi:hypothetical protein
MGRQLTAAFVAIGHRHVSASKILFVAAALAAFAIAGIAVVGLLGLLLLPANIVAAAAILVAACFRIVSAAGHVVLL